MYTKLIFGATLTFNSQSLADIAESCQYSMCRVTFSQAIPDFFHESVVLTSPYSDSCTFFLSCEFAVGSAVLVLTTTEVDKTGASYYGEQGLHYLSSKGDGNIVILSE